MRTGFMSVAVALAAAGTVSATPVLQFDVNSFHTQAVNAGGAPTTFGGLSHTGSVNFSAGTGTLEGLFIQSSPSGPFMNAGFSGFSMTGFNGSVNLTNGMVTGGSLSLELNNGDSYTAQISPGIGAVSTFVGGGFKIEALTQGGMFNDAMFGNVNVAQWFNNQGINGLLGSLLQFNFDPNAQGAASSDMDIFVDASVIPLPPAAYMGLATIGGMIAIRRLRRR